MKGIVDTYWDEISDIMSSEEGFIRFMESGMNYGVQSIVGQEWTMQDWRTQYENYLAARKDDSYDFDHIDDWEGNYWAQYIEKVEHSDYEWKPKKSKDDKTYGSGGSDALPPGYADGGQVTQTGLAWVDGTLAKPERVLSPHQTELFENMVEVLTAIERRGLIGAIADMVDWSSFTPVNPKMTSVDSSNMENNITTVGDVNITLNEAKLQEDADYYEVAQHVGQVFAKELSKQGIRTAFSF
jgi:hypothetical protein